jgi:hypothetical protein
MDVFRLSVYISLRKCKVAKSASPWEYFDAAGPSGREQRQACGQGPAACRTGFAVLPPRGSAGKITKQIESEPWRADSAERSRALDKAGHPAN